MRQLVIGIAIGIVIGASASAVAAGIFGTGYLEGWTVSKDGEEVCDSPFVYPGSKEIECD